jgi:hypothetical protein
MTTPEGKVKEKVKKVLKKFPWVYYHMPVMNGMGSPTLDFICCVNSRYLAIETKAPGQKPTPRQRMTMEEMTKAGAFVFTVSCDEELDILEAYLQVLAP